MLNPEMLVLAREAKGIVQEEFAEVLQVSQGTISRWETGILEPPPGMLNVFSEHLGVTPEFFERFDRVFGFNSTVFFHRQRQPRTDKFLRKLHARMNVLRMRIGMLLRSAHLKSTFEFRALDVSEYQGRVEAIAQIVRAAWRMSPGPVRSVTKAFEDAGGILYKMDFQTKTIDAISEWVPGFPPIILLNTDAEIPASRVRLTLSHGIGHLVMHQFSDGPDVEEQANRFAGEFLMPRREIKASLYKLNLSKLLDLKDQWKVSMAALVYHANRLGTITPSQYKFLNMNLRRRWGIHEPFEENVPLEKPTLVNELVRAHMDDLGYDVQEMSKLLFFQNTHEFESEFLSISKLRIV